jgi:hypothetical protein
VSESSIRDQVFLNLPYDANSADLFVAFIAGVSAFGLRPRATLEIQSGTRRLDRILGLLESCQYSIHDMSRVELDVTPPATPRFNMPFELGLAVEFARHHSGRHMYFVFEAVPYRIQKSLSDLNGTDAYIHEGTIEGVFRELSQIFVRELRQPSLQTMRRIYSGLVDMLPKSLANAGARDPFHARVFQDLTVFAAALAEETVGDGVTAGTTPASPKRARRGRR